MASGHLKSAAVGAVVGAFVAAGTTALATTQVFNLGATNDVDAASTVEVQAGKTVAAPLLELTNTGTGSGTTALSLNTSGQQPPLKVSSNKKVVHLNADLLDGLDSAAFLGATAKAADSDLLDGQDSAAFQRSCQIGTVLGATRVTGTVVGSSFGTTGIVFAHSCTGGAVTARRTAAGEYQVCFAGFPAAFDRMVVGNVVSQPGDSRVNDFLTTNSVNLPGECTGDAFDVQTTARGTAGLRDDAFWLALILD